MLLVLFAGYEVRQAGDQLNSLCKGKCQRVR